MRGVLAMLCLPALIFTAWGCTQAGYDFPDPVGEVTLDGELYMGASGRGAIFWGAARNTGDVTVENVRFVVDVYGGGALLGTFSDWVSTGVKEGDPETTLEVDQVGSFLVHTTVPLGAITRVEHHAEFTIPLEEE